MCANCGKHHSKFKFRGRVYSDKSHNLCFRCYRAILNSLHAKRMANAL